MWRLIFGDGSWVTAPILRPCACLQHPSLYSSLGGGSLLSEHLHQDHLTPTGAKPLGNAKASWPQTGWATCSVISKCLGGGGGCHTNSSRRTCRPPSASGWLRSALWRPAGGEVDAAHPGPSQSESGGRAGGREGAWQSSALMPGVCV